MPLDAKKIAEIYQSKVAVGYDFSMGHFFPVYKKRAFEESSLKAGDRVLVFCCGTGADFGPILEKIGPQGLLVGVDFSGLMLAQAAQKVEQNRWENVELVEADVTDFAYTGGASFDIGVCTLGLSIIPDYRRAYANLLAHIKKSGELIIGDMQLATGWKSIFNPWTLLMAKKFGGTPEGHQNAQDLVQQMAKDLVEVKKREFFLGAYFYLVGTLR